MTKERLKAIRNHWDWASDTGTVKGEVMELICAVESLMAENAALRNFASPVWGSKEDRDFWDNVEHGTGKAPSLP